jgi:hypothetical protein
MVRFALRCDARLDAVLHFAEQSRAAAWAMNGAPHPTHLCSRALGSRPTGLFDPAACALALSVSSIRSSVESSSVNPQSGVVTLPLDEREASRLRNCHAAATAVRHVSIAAERSARCVWADVRWRWTLKVL